MSDTEESPHILISLLEEEEKRLLELIADCIKEHEYRMAHFHSKALKQVYRKLQTLGNIQDINYDRKTFLNAQISYLEEELNSEPSDHMKEYLLRTMLSAKETLARLDQQAAEKTNPEGNENIFDDTLTKLMQKKIRKFRLYLKKKDNLFFELSRSKSGLKIVLPFVKNHFKTFMLNRHSVRSIVAMGFSLVDNENKLVYTTKDEDTGALKIILSKIIFDVFYFKEFANDSFIEIFK
jgi:hypothetical protein